MVFFLPRPNDTVVFLVPVLYGLVIDRTQSGLLPYDMYPLCIHFNTRQIIILLHLINNTYSLIRYDVGGTPTMSSLSTQEGTMTKTSIPAVSNASSAATNDVVMALFPAPKPEEPPRPTSRRYSRGRILKNALSCWPRRQLMAPNGWQQAAAIS